MTSFQVRSTEYDAVEPIRIIDVTFEKGDAHLDVYDFSQAINHVSKGIRKVVIAIDGLEEIVRTAPDAFSQTLFVLQSDARQLVIVAPAGQHKHLRSISDHVPVFSNEESAIMKLMTTKDAGVRGYEMVIANRNLVELGKETCKSIQIVTDPDGIFPSSRSAEIIVQPILS